MSFSHNIISINKVALMWFFFPYLALRMGFFERRKTIRQNCYDLIINLDGLVYYLSKKFV